MEFGEKLQKLRKSKGLTQEDLAEALYISRTAISKWESGRGYPNIESLKQLSGYFSVTIDDLLSGEKLISIAEQENRANVQKIYNGLFGMTDVLSFLLIALPLYPKLVNETVYSVNLFAYTEITPLNRLVYWTLFLTLTVMGLLKMVMTQRENEKIQKAVTVCSGLFGILTVMILALAGETYAVIVSFLLLLIKGALLFQRVKAE